MRSINQKHLAKLSVEQWDHLSRVLSCAGTKAGANNSGTYTRWLLTMPPDVLARAIIEVEEKQV